MSILRTNKKYPKHSRDKGKTIVCFIVGVLFLTVAVLAIVNLPVLKLVFSPENIVISEREESIVVLKHLENVGSVRNLEVSDDMSNISFFSADETIKVTSEYDDRRLRRVSGEIDTGRIKISSVGEGRSLARLMLSPYFNDAETAAILLRYSPNIIAGAVRGNINMSFDIGERYHVVVTESVNNKVDFGIIIK